MKRVFLLLLVVPFITGVSCPKRDQITNGRNLASGCISVDIAATLANHPDNGGDGGFVCDEQGRKPVAQGGCAVRACGDCHRPGFLFGLPPGALSVIPEDDPLFCGTVGDQLDPHGLAFVVDGDLKRMTQVPQLIGLDEKCDAAGNCDSLGVFGDRVTDLDEFNGRAQKNHQSESLAMVPGVDFTPFTAQELEDIRVYLLSSDVERR